MSEKSLAYWGSSEIHEYLKVHFIHSPWAFILSQHIYWSQHCESDRSIPPKTSMSPALASGFFTSSTIWGAWGPAYYLANSNKWSILNAESLHGFLVQSMAQYIQVGFFILVVFHHFWKRGIDESGRHTDGMNVVVHGNLDVSQIVDSITTSKNLGVMIPFWQTW